MVPVTVLPIVVCVFERVHRSKEWGGQPPLFLFTRGVMDSGEFIYKLKRLNPRIYLDLNHRVYSTNPILGSSGIYLKDVKDAPVQSDSKEAQELNSAPDLYIGWMTHGYVPEGDEFDLKTGKLLSPGWRSILKKLTNKKYLPEEKTRKVFRWYPSTYDTLTYDEKLAFERRDKCQQRS